MSKGKNTKQNKQDVREATIDNVKHNNKHVVSITNKIGNIMQQLPIS